MRTEGGVAPIIVLHPDGGKARQIATWLRSAGLGMISTVRTCDEAIFMLGRQNADLLIIDESIPESAERRLLCHIADCGNAPPTMVRLLGDGLGLPDAPGRAIAAELVRKPLGKHDVVVRVGSAMQRPELIGQMDQGRDQLVEHLAAARRMQLGLLPTAEQLSALQAECGAGIEGFYRSGDAVGGDFWGAWPLDRGRFALGLADFAGHGLSAALNTFRLHAILSQQALPRGRPSTMTRLLNQRLHELLMRGQYATMIYAVVDPLSNRFAWCNAGGPPPMFVAPGRYDDLEAPGLPLGIRPKTEYRSNFARLQGPGILCLFSDGLYESGPGANDIPRDAIAKALEQASVMAATGALAKAAKLGAIAIEALRDRHVCPNHSDDVMAVCVALGPTPSPVISQSHTKSKSRWR